MYVGEDIGTSWLGIRYQLQLPSAQPNQTSASDFGFQQLYNFFRLDWSVNTGCVASTAFHCPMQKKTTSQNQTQTEDTSGSGKENSEAPQRD